MKLVIDENISHAEEAFSQFGDVHLMHGRKINSSILKDTDILIVRSITNINRQLLENTPVKFVGTATIGTDHIDKNYLDENKITFTDAKGCNADAVAEYVFTAVAGVALRNNINIKEKTMGVVGIGNIGSRIVRLAEAIGMKVLKNDPPVERQTGRKDFVSLDDILSADIITVHVPLNLEGVDKTVHLFNRENLSKLKAGSILVNASRGQVVDNNALSELLSSNKLYVILDVWENEPAINTELLRKVNIATPHIAGYSLEGKINGTKMIYDAFCDFLKTERAWKPEIPIPEYNFIELENSGNITEDLSNLFTVIFDIKRDDKELKKMLWIPVDQRAAYFDVLRKNYPLRREFLNYKVKLKNNDGFQSSVLKSFRFKV